MGCAHPCEVICCLYTRRITSATHPSAHDGLTSVDEAAVSDRLARALDPDRSAGGTAAIAPCVPLDFGYCSARCIADICSMDLRKAERWTARNPRRTLLAHQLHHHGRFACSWQCRPHCYTKFVCRSTLPASNQCTKLLRVIQAGSELKDGRMIFSS